MTGRNHVRGGIATGVALAAFGVLLMRYSESGSAIMGAIWQYFSNNNWLVVVVGILFFLLGCILPDIDSKTSKIGKIIHLPIKHRTWTHSVWPVLLFAVISWWSRPFAWLAVGYFIHLFWDNLGRAGVCWFYPKPGYKEYAGGARVKLGHWCKLYHNGKRDEEALVWLIIAVALGLLIGALISFLP